MSSTITDRVSLAVVDDDQVYRQYISVLLARRGSFDLHEASSGDELESLIATRTVDCVLLDFDLGSETGFMIKERLDSRGPSCPPIIMLTGDGRERTVIKALRLGLNDYIPKKDLKVEELLSAIRRAVARSREERAVVLERQRLIRGSGLDLASGMYSRAFFDERLTQLSELPGSRRSQYALIIIEILQLRHVIESFGLSAGDRAVRAFADRLRPALRPGDICARFADTQFACIADAQGDEAVVAGLCERLMRELSFRMEDPSASFHLSPLLGFAFASAADVLTPAEFVGAAQDALQQARQAREQIEGAGDPFERSTVLSTLKVGGEPTRLSEPEALRTGDRRREPRQRVLKRGQVILPSLSSTIDCVVRNVSPGGACIRLHSVFALPAEFEFEVSGSGRRRRVRICWQNGNDVGVRNLS